jgi:hypothetical protein
MRKFVLIALGVLLVIGAWIFTHPALVPELPALRADRVEIKNGSVYLDFSTLGDYATDVRTFSISPSEEPSRPIFHLHAGPGELFVHGFSVHAGRNSVTQLSPEGGAYEVLAPKNDDAFSLTAGKKYVAHLCTRSWLRSSVAFTIPAKHSD